MASKKTPPRKSKKAGSAQTQSAAPAHELAVAETLQLAGFGKFRQRSFELGQTTIFFGPNEAGKTTIFDGLFTALCQPRANRADGKRLRERYGENASAEFVLSEKGPGKLPQISEEEFMNLYAVRAGDIRVDISARSSWMDRVKSRLFAGDLDPAGIAKNLGILASDDGKRVHNKELKKLRTELTQIDLELERKNDEQQQLRAREKEIDRVESELATAENESQGLRERVAALALELEQEDQVRERDAWNRRLKLFHQLETIQAGARELQPFAVDEIAGLEELEAALAKARAEVVACESRVQHRAEDLERVRARHAELETQADAARRKSTEADHFLDRLQRSATNRYTKLITEWHRGYLIAAGFAALIGGVAGYFAAPELLPLPGLSEGIAGVSAPSELLNWLVAAACGLIPGGVLVFLARQVREVADDSARRDLLAGLRDDWQARIGEAFPQTETLDGAAEMLTRYRLEFENLQRQIEGKSEQIRERKADLQSVQTERERGVDRERAAGLALQNWLQERQVTDRAAYLMQREELRRRTQECEHLEQELAELAAQNDLADAESLHVECERRLKTLDEAGVSATPRSETAYRGLHSQLSRARIQLEQLARRERELGERRAGNSGELRGGLHRLTEELGALEQSRLRRQADIRDRELDKAAAGAALEIFEELHRDNDGLLEQLLLELGQSVQKILPGGTELRMESRGEFALAELLVPDAGGTGRRIEHLSSGTRDSFVFAARIALAANSREADDPAMLILDEPFLTLDEPRERQCLEFLREFQKERGWQLVILTKEERLRDLAREVFADAHVLHQLVRRAD